MGTSNEELKELLLKLTGKVEDYEKVNSKIISDVQENKKNIDIIKNENDETKNKLEKEISELRREIDNIKSFNRMKNVVLYNMDDTSENNKDVYQRVLRMFREAEIDTNIVETVRRVGKTRGSRIVIVTLTSQKLKKKVFEKSEELNKKFNITIASDISKAERLEFNKLKTIREELKKVDIESRIFNSKLQIGDKMFNYDEAVKMLEDFNKQRIDKIENNKDKIEEKQQNKAQVKKTKKRRASSSPKISNYFNTKKIKDTEVFSQDTQIQEIFDDGEQNREKEME